MKVTYHPEIEALYNSFSFKRGPKQVTTIWLNEDVAVALGPGEEVVGIEVLDASEHLNFDRDSPEVSLEDLKAIVS